METLRNIWRRIRRPRQPIEHEVGTVYPCMGYDVLPAAEEDITQRIKWCETGLANSDIHRVFSTVVSTDVARDIQAIGGEGSGTAAYSEYCPSHCPGNCDKQEIHAS